jgi:hypothetical protein
VAWRAVTRFHRVTVRMGCSSTGASSAECGHAETSAAGRGGRPGVAPVVAAADARVVGCVHVVAVVSTVIVFC